MMNRFQNQNMMSASAHAAEASFSCADTVMILDAIILASIIVILAILGISILVSVSLVVRVAVVAALVLVIGRQVNTRKSQHTV